MAKHKQVTLLHISDTQFGPHHRFGESGSLLKLITDDLEILKKDFALSPEVVVLTGDLTETGDEHEFQQAHKFAEGLLTYLKSENRDITKHRFAIVPGNHDINRESCRVYFSDCENKLKTPEEPYWPKFKNYINFFNEFYRDVVPLPSFKEDAHWTLFEMEDLKLAIAGLNSTIKESHRNGDHYGHIGETQLRWFADTLKHDTRQGWLKIAALHHNFRSGDTGDDAYLRDAKAFTRLLGGSVNLILHGHTHEETSELTSTGVPILATGSAAIKSDKRPEETPNQYQIIQIGPNGYKRWCRAYFPGQTRWIGDTRIHKNGYEWSQEEPSRSFHNLFRTFPNKTDSFADIEGFLEIGDTVTAVDLILNGKPIAESSDIDQHRYLLIKQKFGLPIEDNDITILNNKSCEDYVPDSGIKPIDFALLNIKILSQKGEFEKVIELTPRIAEVLDKNKSAESAELKKALERRERMAKAICNGYSEPVPCSTSCDQHSLVTSDTLEAIAKYFCVANPGDEVFHDSITELRSAQISYLRASTNGKYWQTCRLKSTLQALFSEAAILMSHPGDDRRGWTRLIAAHLLASRITISPLAEGYSELLSMIWCETHKHKDEDRIRKKNLHEQFKMAMGSGYEKRQKFRELIDAYGKRRCLYVQLSKVFDKIPTSNPTPLDGYNLQAYLDEVDGQHC